MVEDVQKTPPPVPVDEERQSDSEATGTKLATRHAKERRGVVIKANAAKTVVVQVDRRVKHPLYGKFLTARKKYAVHDLLGCQVGDQVLIRETRPLSKTKRWRVVEKLGKHA